MRLLDDAGAIVVSARAGDRHLRHPEHKQSLWHMLREGPKATPILLPNELDSNQGAMCGWQVLHLRLLEPTPLDLELQGESPCQRRQTTE